MGSFNKGKNYDKKIKPYLNQYTGFVFEDVCQQYLLRENYNIK
ncbi:MAG: hypothetical protein PWP28_2728, partial [Oceanotoga sp.]|nr:hypothetical protein [Oceanotoga sp.]